jgi:hypothetical protein
MTMNRHGWIKGEGWKNGTKTPAEILKIMLPE